MDLDELDPRKPPHFMIGMDLSRFSIEELGELANQLKAEIERIETARAEKQSSKSAAEDIFSR